MTGDSGGNKLPEGRIRKWFLFNETVRFYLICVNDTYGNVKYKVWERKHTITELPMFNKLRETFLSKFITKCNVRKNIEKRQYIEFNTFSSAYVVAGPSLT